MRYISIVLVLLFISCASRKVDVSKLAIKAKVDSSVVIKIDGTYVKDSNVVTEEYEEEVEYKPADSLKPMVINGKEYINTIIKSKKKRINKISKTKDVAKVSSVKKLNVKKEDNKKVFDKKVERKANYWMYLWLLVPVIIIWALERYGKRLFPFIR